MGSLGACHGKIEDVDMRGNEETIELMYENHCEI